MAEKLNGKTDATAVAAFTDEALKAGMAMAQPREVAGYQPYVVIPPGASVVSLQNFKVPVKDDHRKAKVVLTDPKSLVEYIVKYGGPNTILFADEKAGRFVATLDYHEPGAEGAANWREHTATLQLVYTPEWITWTTSNKHSYNQVDFAEFLESNLLDIFEPKGVEILAAATTLSTKRDINFSSSTRLSDGTVRFNYEETTSEKGAVQLPEMFVLGIAPFKGTEVFKMQARLRYRINSSKLTFFYDLLRADKVLELAVNDIIAHIEAGTGLTCYRGAV